MLGMYPVPKPITTDGIKTRFLGSRYQPELSDPSRGLFTFSYGLSIQNISAKATIQVVGRDWDIVYACGRSELTHGDSGIVGRKPILEPGGVPFEYVSGVPLRHPRARWMAS